MPIVLHLAPRAKKIFLSLFEIIFLAFSSFASDLLPRKTEMQCKSGSELVGARFKTE